MHLDPTEIQEITDSRLLYGFILHHLNLNGDTHKQELYGKVKKDVKYTFPNLHPNYFFSRFAGATDLVFTTVFYFAIFHLRDKGYGLIKQIVQKNEPMMSLSPIGKEFLETSAGKDIFIDYKSIEAFLRSKHAYILEKNTSNLEYFENELNRRFGRNAEDNNNSPATNGIFHFRPLDIVVGIMIVAIIILLAKYFHL